MLNSYSSLQTIPQRKTTSWNHQKDYAALPVVHSKGTTILQEFIRTTEVTTKRWPIQGADEREKEDEWEWE